MAESVRAGLLKHIVRIEEEYPLQDFNPFKAGGVADYFTVANSTIEVAAAVKAAIDLQLPYLVIGDGGKVLFSDGGFPGLVIQNKTSSFALAADKSQIVVDTGIPISKAVSLAVGKGLGGITPFYGEQGTVGGAIYRNLTRQGKDFLSLVRYMTVLMPPTRLDKEATINRYRRDWMERPDGLTKLQHFKATKSYEEAQPVLLTVVLQLTSLRLDELRLKVQQASLDPEKQRPSGVAMGPIFEALPGQSVSDLLKTAGAGRLRVENLYVDRRAPNFIRCKGSSARAENIRQLIAMMGESVSKAHSIDLLSRYEFLGVW